MSILADVLMPVTDLKLLGLVAAGTFAGIYVGAIPGLSVTMAVSILISFTFSWDVYPALALMIGIYMGGVYGGSRTAILLNIPGAPSAIATAMDGFPLAQQAARSVPGATIVAADIATFAAQPFGIAQPFVDFLRLPPDQVARLTPVQYLHRTDPALTDQVMALNRSALDDAALEQAKRALLNPKVRA